MAVEANEEVTDGGWFIGTMKQDKVLRLRQGEGWGVLQLGSYLNNVIYVLIPTADPVLCALETSGLL